MQPILISVGSNIAPVQNTQSGLDALQEIFGDIQLSPVYESESVGFDGNNFLNLVVLAQTKMAIDEIVSAFKRIEAAHGRVRGEEKFASRTLDLDLLTFGDTICTTPIILPREEILYNAFVLRPLADLVPNWLHPIENKPYAELWQQYDSSKQRLWISDFAWSKNK